MVDRAFLQEVRDRLSLSQFVGRYVELKRAGRNHKACCPFHQEKTPSFMVSDEKQIFHCFGCGVGGDIFSFVMKHQGMSFPEAVEFLAGQAGLEVPKSFDRGADKKRDELFHAMAEAAKFYSRILFEKEGEDARRYLGKRSVTKESTVEHALGFAPSKGDALVGFLRSKKISFERALELNLIRKSDDGRLYDFFRGRLMFPIFNPRGKIIAFSGRALGEVQGPKYINSPESSIFHKSNAVYGLDKAGQEIRKENSAIVVEGQLDVIAMHQHGFKNAVAPLGTAFTTGHIHVIGRYSKNITLLFDGDEAGRKAAWRLLPIFIGEDLMPKAVTLPSGEDPDSFLKKNEREVLDRLIKEAPLLLEFVLSLMLRKESNNESRLEAIKHLVPIVEKVTNPMERNLYMKVIGERLGIPQAVLAGKQLAADPKGRPPISVDKPERVLAKALVKNPELYKDFSSDIKKLNVEDSWASTLIGIVSRSFLKGNEKSANLLMESDDDELKQEISLISLEPACEGEPKDVVVDCLRSIKRRDIEKAIAVIDNDLKRSGGGGVDEMELLRRRGDLEKERRQLMVGSAK